MSTRIEAEANFRRSVASKSGEVVGTYAGVRQKVCLRCHLGHEWEASPASITRQNAWCPFCAGVSPVAAEAKFREVVDIKGGVVIGEYRGAMTKTRIRCSHGHEWEATPTSLTSQHSWCPFCAGLSPIAAEANFRTIISRNGGVLLGEYRGAVTKTRLRCLHGHEWEVRPRNITNNGSWCPVCFRLRRTRHHADCQGAHS